MRWADAVPNLLIGLREGLEAGLVVSILLAALRRARDEGRSAPAAPVWLGVLGAVMVAGSLAAVLTYSTSALSSQAQEAVGGMLSVLAVGLVTGMVFWMRRTARGLTAQLRGEVSRALSIGAGALALTAFLTVGREGLETTLFLWAAVRATGQTVAPLTGAGLGLGGAVLLCWLLYRRAIRVNLGAFFNRTALALIVIAAGVLAYGLGDLQEAGLLPGIHWVVFDLSAHVDPNSWWVALISGVSELTPRMTVLQVVAWIGFLSVVVPRFILAGRVSTPERRPAQIAGKATVVASHPSRWARLAGRRSWLTAAVLVIVPVAAASTVIIALPGVSAASTPTLTVSQHSCAEEWTAGHTGAQTFLIANTSGSAGEINLDNTAGGVVAEIETLGPGTTAPMSATLTAGTYTFKCYLSGLPELSSRSVPVSGSSVAAAPAGIVPITLQDLVGPNDAYQAYAARDLTTLAAAVDRIHSDLLHGNLVAGRADWLTAQLDWEGVGASYDSFGDLGVAIDGLPDGLAQGVEDPDFTGLHRLEYGLWHGQSTAILLPVVETLGANLALLQHKLTSDAVAGDPTNLPLRAHEILEDALRDHLSGLDDEGSGMADAETYADVEVTRVVVAELTPLINARAPHLVATATEQLDALGSALVATQSGGQWRSLATVPLLARQQVDAAIGALLETLSSVPDLLEMPPHQ